MYVNTHIIIQIHTFIHSNTKLIHTHNYMNTYTHNYMNTYTHNYIKYIHNIVSIHMYVHVLYVHKQCTHL